MELSDVLQQGRFLFDTVKSEEFQALLEYPEGKALIEQIIRGGTEFVFEDSELTGKILITLGMPEDTVNLLVENLNGMNEAGLDIQNLMESEKSQKILHFIVENLDNDEFLSKVENAFETLGIYSEN